MTGLERLRGVRRSGSLTVEQVEADADSLGWRCVVLDGSEVESKEAFLESCDEAFGLPDWLGMNWDALEECLADLDLGGALGVVVAWEGWAGLASADPKAFATAVDVLASAVRSWRGDGVSGGVLLLGEPPEDDDVDVDVL